MKYISYIVADGNYYINSMLNNFLWRQIKLMKNHWALANYVYKLPWNLGFINGGPFEIFSDMSDIDFCIKCPKIFKMILFYIFKYLIYFLHL